MYPITVRELHAGWVLGEERILVTREGQYGWNDSTPLSALRVHCFDEQAEGAAPTAAVCFSASMAVTSRALSFSMASACWARRVSPRPSASPAIPRLASTRTS